MAPLTAEVIFVIMLGSAIWTSLQLTHGTPYLQNQPFRATGKHVALEGIVCALVWAIMAVLMSQSLALLGVAQGVVAGAVWTIFGLIARLSFQRAPVLK